MLLSRFILLIKICSPGSPSLPDTREGADVKQSLLAPAPNFAPKARMWSSQKDLGDQFTIISVG
jgi:hypothetical protein